MRVFVYLNVLLHSYKVNVYLCASGHSYASPPVATDKKDAQNLQQLAKAELRSTYDGAPTAVAKVHGLFTPVGRQLGWSEVENSRNPAGGKMTWEQNQKAILQSHYQNGILYPSLLLRQKIAKIRNTIANISDPDSVVQPDLEVSMNQQLLEAMKLKFPDLINEIDRMKSFDFATETRKRWPVSEWASIRPGKKNLSDELSLTNLLKEMENLCFYMDAYKFPMAIQQYQKLCSTKFEEGLLKTYNRLRPDHIKADFE